MQWKLALILLLIPNFLYANLFDDLKAQLKSISTRTEDPYANEYEGLRENVRFPELIHQDERYVLIDNFRDLGGRGKEGISKPVWNQVLIDIEKVKSVKWMMCVFVIKAGFIKYQAGHAQMVFEFEEGGAMLPDREIRGIVNSFEIIPPKGVNYDPIVKGMTGYYDNSVTLSSFEYGVLSSASKDTRIELFTLDLSHEDMKRLLKISLREAFNKEYVQANKYHTTRNSCVTNQFRILNEFLGKELKIPEWNKVFGLKLMRTFGTIVPRRVGKTLKKHGLVKETEIYPCPDEAMKYYARLQKTRIFDTLYR